MWYSEWGYYRHVESYHDRNKIQIGNEKIEATLESLEKLVNERDAHLQSLENKKEFIKKLKHHKISHEMTSIMNIINKESSVKNEEVLSKENHEEDHKTPITLPVCVICHSLVCHESTKSF
jgi:FKBP-type peptidyl-prolyl cis-trans isomerase (trigger factor)